MSHKTATDDLRIYNEARAAFEEISDEALQARLSAWQARNFGPTPLYRNVLGAVEEVGELAHALLKHEQKIRNMEDTTAAQVVMGDAIADAMVFLIQACTALRLDCTVLLEKTAEKVMLRDFTRNSATGGEK